MTKPRKKPNTRFHAFLVEPKPGFKPTNWQQNPEHYRILEYIGPKHFIGRADAWKFLHNHEQMSRNSIKSWAIYLDFKSSFLSSKPMDQDSTIDFIQRRNLVSADIEDTTGNVSVPLP
jgi:hypothetical protein